MNLNNFKKKWKILKEKSNVIFVRTKDRTWYHATTYCIYNHNRINFIELYFLGEWKASVRISEIDKLLGSE